MAVTEKNQWLHVLLIIFVMLAIAGGVGTYLGVTSANAAHEKMEEAQRGKLEQEEYLKVADMVKDAVLAYVGAGASVVTVEEAEDMVARVNKQGEASDKVKNLYADPLNAVKATYDADMKDAPQNIQTWRALATFLVGTVSSKNKTIQEKDNQIRQTKSEADSKVKEAEDRATVAEKEASDAKAALEREKTQFAQTIAKLNGELATLKQNTNDNLVTVQRQLQQVQENEKQLRSVITVRENTIAVQSDIIEKYRRTDFDVPDGRITSVNATSKVVWLNLGYLDALPNQLKFSVYDSQAAELNESAKKGEIKIQRIVGPHTSEAIITVRDDLNPILPDDFVFTSTWTPGQRTKYYLAGKFDLDGDGKSDQERVKALLIRAGGEIVGELKQDGTTDGAEIEPNVRFLVLGGKPDDAALNAEVDKIRKKAADEGVKSIGVDILLTQLGLGSEARVISRGSEINSGFQKRRPNATIGK